MYVRFKTFVCLFIGLEQNLGLAKYKKTKKRKLENLSFEKKRNF